MKILVSSFGDVGSPSDASNILILVVVMPLRHTEGSALWRYAKYRRTELIIFGSRSRALRNRPSPANDCCVRCTMGGRIGSSGDPVISCWLTIACVGTFDVLECALEL